VSLQGRLDALARRAREAGYFTDAEPCRSCGWPCPGAPRFVEVEVRGDAEPRRCSTCGNYVDDVGDALGAVRTTVVLVGLRLEKGRSSPAIAPERDARTGVGIGARSSRKDQESRTKSSSA